MYRKNRKNKKINLFNLFTLIPKQYSYLKALYSEQQLMDLYEKYKIHINFMSCFVYDNIFDLIEALETKINSNNYELIIDDESIYIKITYHLDFGFYCFDLFPLLKKCRSKKKDFVLGFYKYIFSNIKDNYITESQLDYLKDSEHYDDRAFKENLDDYNFIIKNHKKYHSCIDYDYFEELLIYNFNDSLIKLMQTIAIDFRLIIKKYFVHDEEYECDDNIPFNSRFINVLGDVAEDFVINQINNVYDSSIDEIETIVELGDVIKENTLVKRFNKNLIELCEKLRTLN